MVTIYLDSKKSYSSYGQVTRHNYSHCGLFIKYKHEPTKNLGAEYTYVYDKYVWYLAPYATFRPLGEYESAHSHYAEVYYNVYDTGLSRPLLLVLYFKEPKINKSRFITYSTLKPLIVNSGTMNISEMNEFDSSIGDEQLLDHLLNENDRLGFLTTFQIDIKTMNKSYNDGKIDTGEIVFPDISFSILFNMGDILKRNGFTCYAHIHSGKFKSNKTTILFNKKFLIGSNGTDLLEVQNRPYSYVNVYWSNKLDMPLLLEFNDRRENFNNNNYYYHKVQNSILFWSLVKPKDYELFTGYRFLNHQTIFQQLNEIANDVVIIDFLKNIENNLFETIVLLIDRFNGFYGDRDVKKSLGTYNYNIINNMGNIHVTNIASKGDGTCLNGTDFIVYQHDFDNLVRSARTRNLIKLKLISSTVESYTIDCATFYLDKTLSDRFMYGSFEILVSHSYNSVYNYTWFKHSSENNVLKDRFRLYFKGHSVIVNYDLNVNETNHRVLHVYFKTGETNAFVLVAFPLKNQTSIRYLTYDKFKKTVHTKSSINLSSLPKENGSFQSNYHGQTGSRTIDEDLRKILDKESPKHCVVYIQLDKTTRSSYESEAIKINVSQYTDSNLSGYKIFTHHFTSSTKFYDILFYNTGVSKILDVTGYFDYENITQVFAYFHEDKLEIPLLIGLSSNKVIKYFNFAEFVYDVNDVVKLSDLDDVKHNEIKSKLQDQFDDLKNIMTIKVSSSENYSSAKVSAARPLGNYKYYIHTPRKYFNHIKLEENASIELLDFMGEQYTFDNFLDSTIYYHAFDKENRCPLIIEFYTKKVNETSRGKENSKDKYEVSGVPTFYFLNMIDERTSKKIYKKSTNTSTNVESFLKGIYTFYRNRIDPIIGIKGYDTIDTFYYKNNTKLYSYFHKRDPRPLVFCYDNQAYKRYYIDGNNSKWTKIPNVRTCICTQSRTRGQIDSSIMDALNDVANTLNLIKKEKPVETKHSETSINIDLVKKSTSYEGSISVSTRQNYTNSDLFCYYTHYRYDHSSFTISSFISSISVGISYGANKITHLSKTIKNIKSVTVYFNIFDESFPIMIEILHSDEKIEHYEVLKSRDKYTIKENPNLNQGTDLVDKLIEISDKNNGRLTYRIDKTIQSYGSVSVSKESKNGFIVYTHSSGDNAKPSNVLNDNKLLKIESVKESDPNYLQNKKYDDIKVYFLEVNKSSPLVIEFNETGKAPFSIFKRHLHEPYKILEGFNSTNEKEVKTKLSEIHYFLNKSVIIELNKVLDIGYNARLIENKPHFNSLLPSITDFIMSRKLSSLGNIKISNPPIKCTSVNVGSFKRYQHNFSELKRTSDYNDIGGLRVYFSPSNDSSDMKEIELYKSKNTRIQDREFIYYTPEANLDKAKYEFSVYFHGDDPRPLLFSYNEKAYVQKYNHQWYHDNNVNCKDDCNILKKLIEIYDKIKGKLLFVRDGDTVNILTSLNVSFGDFIKDSYKPNASYRNKDFKLPKKVLTGQTSSETNIDKLLDKMDRRPFDTVNVYREKTGSSSIKDILLIEFIFDSHKTHFKRTDIDGNHWVDEEIIYSGDHDLKKELQNIKSNLVQTFLYEIDKKLSYSSNINIDQPSLLGTEFTKYVHTPSKNALKSSLIFYKKEKLLKKVRNQYSQLTEIEKQNYSTVTVYFGTKETKGNINCPLLLELNYTNPVSNAFYVHKRDENKHFWEPFTFRSKSYDIELLSKLRESQFNLVDSIVLLMDKFTNSYGDDLIKQALETFDPPKEINLPSLYQTNITLNRTVQTIPCASKYGFKIVSHYLGTIDGKDNCGLRFFIPTSNNKFKYNELDLFDCSGLVEEYLYYNSQSSDVHFFYYGSDPRPLLLYYGNKAYKPNDKSSYFERWCRDDRIKSFTCQNVRENRELLQALSEVVGMLNEVKLDIKPYSIDPTEKSNQYGLSSQVYEIHTYAGDNINIKVSYKNGSCYRLYRHEPNGNSGNGHGFRLGKLTYEGMSNVRLDYDFNKQLKAVTVYYSLFDHVHKYPLLVQLEFKENDDKEYYELNDHKYIKWKAIDYKIYDSDVEYRIKQIVDKLGVQFNKNPDSLTLFDSKECFEDSGLSTTTIAAASGGTVTTAGLVGVGTTLATHPEWVITSIKALI